MIARDKEVVKSVLLLTGSVEGIKAQVRAGADPAGTQKLRPCGLGWRSAPLFTPPPLTACQVAEFISSFDKFKFLWTQDLQVRGRGEGAPVGGCCSQLAAGPRRAYA
jgi:hypothetical protein